MDKKRKFIMMNHVALLSQIMKFMEDTLDVLVNVTFKSHEFNGVIQIPGISQQEFNTPDEAVKILKTFCLTRVKTDIKESCNVIDKCKARIQTSEEELNRHYKIAEAIEKGNWENIPKVSADHLDMNKIEEIYFKKESKRELQDYWRSQIGWDYPEK